MELTPGPLYKPPVGSKRMRDGLASPGAAEILLEWVLRTIGTADSQGEIRRRIFNGANCPPLGEAVPRARQCLAENNHGGVAALIPEYDRKKNGSWKTFEAAAGFDQIKRELQQAGQVAVAAVPESGPENQPTGSSHYPQVFSPHELLNRPRSLMRSALPDRCSRSRSALRLVHPARSCPRRPLLKRVRLLPRASWTSPNSTFPNSPQASRQG